MIMFNRFHVIVPRDLDELGRGEDYVMISAILRLDGENSRARRASNVLVLWRELDTLLSDDIDAALALWQQRADMPGPHEKHPDGHHPGQSSSNDESTDSQSNPFHIPSPQLSPETYNYLIHEFLSLQDSPPYPSHTPAYPYPIHPNLIPNYNFPWPPPIPPTSLAGPSSFYPQNLPIPYPPPSQIAPSPLASATTPPTTQDTEGENATSATDDKRRSNTAASARFRAKKKVKTLNLERTVADLTGRTEVLEREATDLRRENAWLKEIVLLKGNSLANMNPGPQAAGPSNQHGQDDEDDRDAESESESTPRRREKGKGKETR